MKILYPFMQVECYKNSGFYYFILEKNIVL